MKICLFDLYASGHHLPYARRIKEALETVSKHDVTFITYAETDQCNVLFEPDEIGYVGSPESPPIDDHPMRFASVADSAIHTFCTGDDVERYDVVHFLYADDILGSLWRHSHDIENPRIVGELNGVFFHRGTILRRKYLHQGFLWLLSSKAGSLINHVVPDRASHEMLWQDLYLYRCLTSETFDRLVVHSQEATEYLSRLNIDHTSTITELPYPAPEKFGTEISQRDARKRLDLPVEDSILLFFGSMKNEKGIDLLLDALREYRGPKFTMVLAGPLVTVTEQELRRLDRQTSVTMVYSIGYIDSPELYYRAADAVVLPYKRTYGKERASQLFEEAVGSNRPVIVPNVGVLGRVTEEWELGTTFEQGSIQSLTDALRRFATGGISFSIKRMQEYSAEHSYETTARNLLQCYEPSQNRLDP